MSSIFSSGIIPLMADEEVVAKEIQMCGYPFSIPKVFLDGSADSYYPQVDFSWSDDAVVVLRDTHLTIYTKSSFTELLAEDENGNVIWVDGRSAPYEGCWSGKYLNKTRSAQEYTIVEYNLASAEKKTYKVLSEETVPFDDCDRRRLNNFVDSEVLDNTFEIEGGILRSYNGSSDNVQIPDSVTIIDWWAFSKYETITNLYISKSVVEISTDATRRVINNVIVDPDNPRYYCHDGLLIDRETKTILRAYAGDKIPDDGSITAIGDSAFSHRSDIKYMEIPNSVTKIGYNAFCECVNLEKVVISDSVTTICGRAFYGCDSLAEIKLPSAITEISGGMLAHCTKLKSITIPDTVTIIENEAFSNCNSLEKLIIPDSVTKIEFGAFQFCTSLSEIKLPSFITYIPPSTFLECSQLKHITIPQSVLQIASNAFCVCSSLEEINIPDTVIEIESYAFSGCTSLKKAHLPNGIVTIETGVFQNCKQLLDIEIPNTVAIIGDSAFCGCTELAGIIFPSAVKKICAGAFAESGLTSLSIPDSIKVIEYNAFRKCCKLEQVDIPICFAESGERIFGKELTKKDDSGRYYLQPVQSVDKADSTEIDFFKF